MVPNSMMFSAASALTAVARAGAANWYMKTRSRAGLDGSSPVSSHACRAGVSRRAVRHSTLELRPLAVSTGVQPPSSSPRS